MYDSIIFEKSPVKCECGHEQIRFQTKQYECMSDVYKITENNELLCERSVWKLTEAFKKDDSVRPIAETKHLGWDKLDWTDTIYCYSHCDKCHNFWFNIVLVYIKGEFDSMNVEKIKLEHV